MTEPAPIEPDTKDWTWVLDRPCPECGFDAATVERTGLGAAIRANAEEWQQVLAAPQAAERGGGAPGWGGGGGAPRAGGGRGGWGGGGGGPAGRPPAGPAGRHAEEASASGSDVPAAVTEGRTVTLPVTKDTTGPGRSVQECGWQLAHWAVANASALRIERVSYAGREWTAGNTDSQWRAAGAGSTEAAGAGSTEAAETSGATGPTGAGGGTGSVRIVTAQ